MCMFVFFSFQSCPKHNARKIEKKKKTKTMLNENKIQ